MFALRSVAGVSLVLAALARSGSAAACSGDDYPALEAWFSAIESDSGIPAIQSNESLSDAQKEDAVEEFMAEQVCANRAELMAVNISEAACEASESFSQAVNMTSSVEADCVCECGVGVIRGLEALANGLEYSEVEAGSEYCPTLVCLASNIEGSCAAVAPQGEELQGAVGAVTRCTATTMTTTTAAAAEEADIALSKANSGLLSCALVALSVLLAA